MEDSDNQKVLNFFIEQLRKRIDLYVFVIVAKYLQRNPRHPIRVGQTANQREPCHGIRKYSNLIFSRNVCNPSHFFKFNSTFVQSMSTSFSVGEFQGEQSFVSHDSPILNRFRISPKVSFYSLLSNSYKYQTWILSRIMPKSKDWLR